MWGEPVGVPSGRCPLTPSGNGSGTWLRTDSRKHPAEFDGARHGKVSMTRLQLKDDPFAGSRGTERIIRRPILRVPLRCTGLPGTADFGA